MKPVKEKVACLICGEEYSPTVLPKHVNSCLDKQEFNPDFKPSDVEPQETEALPQKRIKLSETNAAAENESQIAQSEGPVTDNVPTSSSVESNIIQSKPQKINTFPLFKKRDPEKRKALDTDNQSPAEQKDRKTPLSSELSDTPKRKTFVWNTKREIDKSDSNTTSAEVTPTKSDSPKRKTSDSKTQDSASISLEKLNIPLAEQMRPTCLDNYVGQDTVIGQGKLLRELVQSHQLPSIILWGPPGCGKTTLARLIAQRCRESHNSRFTQLSATMAGVADVKEVVKVAKNDLKMLHRRTLFFVDEIHRFNKLQQDAFLPHVEDGTITLLGATTENPSFYVTSALLSRCRVVVLAKLDAQSVSAILRRALTRLTVTEATEPPQTGIAIHPDALQFLANCCDGDARNALNGLESALRSRRGHAQGSTNEEAGLLVSVDEEAGLLVSVEDVKEALQRSHVKYDRAGDEHYHCASALQKSIRGSSDSGALYWMARMLEGGEDPLFIARRLLVCASEDIGLADSQALPLAMATFQACQALGKPECAIPLAHCTTYLARCSKSNESFRALQAARQCIRDHEGPVPSVPLHLRNASTLLAKQLGYGKEYKYSHNYSGAAGQQDYLPAELQGVNFYQQTLGNT